MRTLCKTTEGVVAKSEGQAKVAAIQAMVNAADSRKETLDARSVFTLLSLPIMTSDKRPIQAACTSQQSQVTNRARNYV
jgi:hypothetical protein